ncbi:MAG: class I SAM-dependent methyltransferase [Candidatus Aminicenantia bacterium]
MINYYRLSVERERIGTWGYLNSSRLEVIFQFSGKKVLDVGCSRGNYVRFLLGKGYDAYGLDIIYHREWEELKERFKQGEINKLPYNDEEFDTLLLFEILEHLENPEGALKEVRRVSKKNIIVSVPDCELYPFMRESGLTFHHWIDRTHLSYFTEKELKDKLREHGFEIVYFKRINPVHPEIMLFQNFGLSLKISKFLSRVITKIKFKNIYMTLLCVGEKIK